MPVNRLLNALCPAERTASVTDIDPGFSLGDDGVEPIALFIQNGVRRWDLNQPVRHDCLEHLRPGGFFFLGGQKVALSSHGVDPIAKLDPLGLVRYKVNADGTEVAEHSNFAFYRGAAPGSRQVSDGAALKRQTRVGDVFIGASKFIPQASTRDTAEFNREPARSKS